MQNETQPHPGFELKFSTAFPMTITITLSVSTHIFSCMCMYINSNNRMTSKNKFRSRAVYSLILKKWNVENINVHNYITKHLKINKILVSKN